MPHETEGIVGARLRAFLTGDGFSCVGAKMALERSGLVHRHYGRLATPEVTALLHHDLRGFADRRREVDPDFATFVATFDGPAELDEPAFEWILWQQLQRLHDLDGDEPAWHPDFDSFPASDRFGYCIGGHPFFIVGMHSRASRISRRFAYPAMAFNSHEQFDHLHRIGVFRRLRSEIRRRELRLQGSVNPSFVDYPGLEARQYAGRETAPDWICPFQPRTHATAAVAAETAAVLSPRGEPRSAVVPRQIRCTRTKLIMLWAEGTSVLDVCDDHDLPVESLCRSGVCGRCAVRLVAGQVGDLVTPLADPPPGYVLACVTEPVTDIELDL